MGWKDWVYGDLVSAADFQSLVQDQTVQRYADSAARTSALGSAVAEGMVSYLDSTNQVEVYDGSSWGSLGSSGVTNLVINGAFDVWQRGTSSFTSTGYTADRWYGSIGGTTTISRNTDVPSGIQAQYSIQWLTGASSSFGQFYYALETAQVATMRGQSFTLSFYVKTAGSMAGNLEVQVNYSTSTDALVSQSTAVTTSGDSAFSASSVTSWSRKTVSFTVPTDAVGLRFAILPDTAQASGVTCRVAGVQLEAGSSATSFKRNAPSIQGELAACQRYYWRNVTGASYGYFATGYAESSTATRFYIQFPVPMRTIPSSVEYGGGTIMIEATPGAGINASSVTIITATAGYQGAAVSANVTGATQYRPYSLLANSSPAQYLGFSAEL